MTPDQTVKVYRAVFAALFVAWFAAVGALGAREVKRAYPEQVATFEPYPAPPQGPARVTQIREVRR